VIWIQREFRLKSLLGAGWIVLQQGQLSQVGMSVWSLGTELEGAMEQPPRIVVPPTRIKVYLNPCPISVANSNRR
jgi:hypothetical protein